jgi:uncharacterized protein YndB with AHSA1/START domain
VVHPRYQIDYERAFTFAAPVDRVWATLSRPDQYPRWWPWLHDFTIEGDAFKPGTVLRGVVVPPIPYRLHLCVEIDDAEAEHHVAANVHGDLEGLARIDLDAAGTRTRVVASWNVEMMQAPMRLAASLGMTPLLRWGHDRVVETTVATFRRQSLAGR